MEKLSRIWSAGVAYVALIIGAGLSIAGNVADTYRTRGIATDVLDVILAGAAPLLVLLTIELFVSRLWSNKAAFQALRWAGCLAIGVLAMGVSWVHLHDLLLSRGQLAAVAAFWPFAIDGMAIMATGLILSTRDRSARPSPVPPLPVMTSPGKSVLPGLLTPPPSAETETMNLWERISSEMNDGDAPVSPAPYRAEESELVSPSPIPRVSRGEVHPALREAISELISGEMPQPRDGAGKSTLARYVRVWRILRDNPNADIDARAERIRPELLDEMRGAARLEVVR